jgi:hypothetical protein
MISPKALQLFADVKSETFVEDLQSYLTQRLADEKALIDEFVKTTSENPENPPVDFKIRPVTVRFQFATKEARMHILAVGKDFAVCQYEDTKRTDKINFNLVVSWRDISDDNLG